MTAAQGTDSFTLAIRSMQKYWNTTPYHVMLNPRMASDNNASIIAFLVSLFMLGVVDILFFSNLVKVGGTNARWFGLHSFANLFVVIFSLPDVLELIVNPINCLNPKCDFSSYACTDLPVCIIAAIHLYHILAFRLTWDDWFHHLVFALCIVGLHFCYNWGPASSFLSFFISGFPGGVDYYMLTLVKLGKMPSLQEKRINRYINVWCRGPGCLATGVLVYTSYMSGFKQVNPIALFFGVGLVVFNGQYYMERVVANVRRTPIFQNQSHTIITNTHFALTARHEKLCWNSNRKSQNAAQWGGRDTINFWSS